LKSVSLIGPWPPPMGGVSIYMRRMLMRLRQEGWDVRAWNESRLTFQPVEGVQHVGGYRQLLPYLFRDPSPILHAHTTSPRFLQFFPLFRLVGKKLILTIHSPILPSLLERGDWNARILRFAFKQMHAIVCVGDALFEQMCALGFSSDQLHVIPSYLPADHAKNTKLPDEVQGFLNRCGKGPLLAANGTIRFVMGGDDSIRGRELYGVDQMVAMMSDPCLQKHDPALVVYLSSMNDMGEEQREWFQMLKQEIVDRNLSDRVLLYESEDDEFAVLLPKAKVMLRPTWWEGFGISVLEAFDAGCAVIAADSTLRQEGCLRYRAGDVKDFASVLDKTLAGPSPEPVATCAEVYFASQLALYEKLL
jgi:glycosyltransferase involved in cell wall biosynthesis